MTAPVFNTCWSVLLAGLDCTCMLWALVTAAHLVRTFSPQHWAGNGDLRMLPDPKNALFPRVLCSSSFCGNPSSCQHAQHSPVPQAAAPKGTNLPPLLCGPSADPSACFPSGWTCRPQASGSIQYPALINPEQNPLLLQYLLAPGEHGVLACCVTVNICRVKHCGKQVASFLEGTKLFYSS